MRTLDDKVVVITGATAGVGRATARLAAQQGARVALLARDQDRLRATQRELEELGAKVFALSVDVAEPQDIEGAARDIEAALGPIDVWISNAMTTVFGHAWEIEPAEYRRVTEVTYLGAVWGAMAALQRMRPRNRGTIVLVGSALAFVSIPLQSAYCGAKHAIKGFADSLREELTYERSAVRVVQVELPAVNTPQFSWCETKMPGAPKPLGAVYQPEVAARAILAATLRGRADLYATASSAFAIWAGRLVPGPLARYLARTAVKGQQQPRAVDPRRPANLWQPVPGAFAAHGEFDGNAKARSVSLWMNLHRGAIAAAALFVIGVPWIARAMRRR